MIRSGAMRHTVRFERRSPAQDAAGEPLNEWILYAERRCAIERTPGREVWASAQRSGRVPVVLRLRWLSGLLPGMRAVLGEKALNILSAVDPDGRGAELLVTAEELVEATP